MIYLALVLITIALTVGVSFKAQNPEQDYVSSITDGLKKFCSDVVFVIKSAKSSGDSEEAELEEEVSEEIEGPDGDESSKSEK